jgi:hypothetical protein
LHVAIAGYALDSTGAIGELGTEPVADDMVGGGRRSACDGEGTCSLSCCGPQ